MKGKLALMAFVAALALASMLVGPAKADMLIQPTNWTSSDWDTPENAFDLDMSTLASASYRANFGEGGDGLSYLYANYTAKPDSSIFLAYHFGNECGDCNISLWIWNYDDTDWSMLGYLDSPFDSSVHNATFPLEVNDTFAQDGEYDIMLVGHSYVEIGGLEYMTAVNELELFVPPANISDCTELNDTGQTYLLTSDITDSSAEACINITADNVTLDCQGFTIDGSYSEEEGIYNQGIRIYRSGSTDTNINLENCVVTGWDWGVYLKFSNANTITNLTASGNNRGIRIEDGSGNEITDSAFSGNDGYGVELYRSTNNNVTDSRLNENADGIGTVWDSNYNQIINNEIRDNTEFGMYSFSSGYNEIYNNLWNNTNSYSEDGSYGNFWNTTRQVGSRIYSAGTDIGGNYWTNPEGNGYSDTCYDIEGDGLCDSAMVLIQLPEYDYLPLSDQYGAPTWFVLTFNYASVSFGALSAGSADNPAPNQLEGAYNATVNTSVAYYKIEASGSDFTDESETFAFGIDMLKMGMNETAAQLDAGDSVALGADPQVIETDIPSTTTDTFHGWWLSIPEEQYGGHYTSTVTITYSNIS